MSFDVSVIDHTTDEPRKFPVTHHKKGGTYRLGGSYLAELNVAYNYSHFYIEALGHSFRELDGQRVRDSMLKMRQAVSKLGTKKHDNYWKATRGNAGAALNDLVEICENCHPEDKIQII